VDEALINEVNLRCISQKSTRYRAGKLALALFTAALFAGPTVAQITNPPAIKPLRAVDPGPRPVGNQSIVVKGAILNTGIVDTAQPMDADASQLGFRGRRRDPEFPPKSEPMRHPLGLCEMRSVSVGLPDPTSISSSLRAIRDARLVNVHHSATPELVIEFTSQKEVQHSIHSLGLSLVGRQAPPH